MPPPSSYSASDEERHIAAEITVLHDDAVGQPAWRLEAHLVDDVVVCVIELPLSTVEQTLLDGGAETAQMLDRRRQVEQCLRASMVAVVEHSTGREVVGFFTDAQLEPPLTIDVFRLSPSA
jgi:uncharacterized protein YbcI